MTLIDNLIHTATIQRRAVAATASIGASYTWTSTSTGVSVWVQVAGQREVNDYARLDMVVTHKVYFNTDPTAYFGNDPALSGKYRLLMVGGPFDGQTFEVRSQAEATAGFGLLWKVMLEYTPADELT